MKLLAAQRMVIPDGITFGSLRLQQVNGGVLKFDYDVLRTVWVATGYHPDLLVSAGTAEVASFIVHFYAAYVGAGGFADVETAALVRLLRDDTMPGRRLVPI